MEMLKLPSAFVVVPFFTPTTFTEMFSNGLLSFALKTLPVTVNFSALFNTLLLIADRCKAALVFLAAPFAAKTKMFCFEKCS